MYRCVFDKTLEVVAIIICLVGIASAQTAVKPAGSGTGADPFRIDSLPNLYWLSQDTANMQDTFVQTKNIDARPTRTWDSDSGFFPIGVKKYQFSGVYHGQGHVISNLYIHRLHSHPIGLFGNFSGSVDSLGLVNDTISGENYVGGFAGYELGTSNMIACYAVGAVSGSDYVGGLVGWQSGNMIAMHDSGSVSGLSNVGGLVGSQSSGTLSNSYNLSRVQGSRSVGGIVGLQSGHIQGCHNHGNVLGFLGSQYIGGITGNLLGKISSSFNAGSVTADSGTYVGGISGTAGDSSQISFSYNTGSIGDFNSIVVGGLVGRLKGILTESYNVGVVAQSLYGDGLAGVVEPMGSMSKTFFAWDLVNQDSHFAGDSAISDSAMKYRSTFAGWDFNSTWFNIDGQSFPLLQDVSGQDSTPALPSGTLVSSTISVRAQGSGTPGDPYQIDSLPNLNWLARTPSVWNKNFVQLADIDATPTKLLDHGKGFLPIGNLRCELNFSGNYHGGGHSIEGLFINRPYPETEVGLFGMVSGNIDSLSLVRDTIFGFVDVGSLVGQQSGGTIANCSSSGMVWGMSHTLGSQTLNAAQDIGGLVGIQLKGKITASQSRGRVWAKSLSENIGGLVGLAMDTIINSHSSGFIFADTQSIHIGGLIGASLENYPSAQYLHRCSSSDTIFLTYDIGSAGGLVGSFGGHMDSSFSDGFVQTGNEAQDIGGLVGSAEGTISSSYSTDSVSVQSFSMSVGGLIGGNNSMLSNSYSTGAVSVGDYSQGTGGLVGLQGSNRTVHSSYSSSNVTGHFQVGGLIGGQGGNIFECYSTGSVKGDTAVGGLVGVQGANIVNSYSMGSVVGDTAVGGLVGTQYKKDSILESYSTGFVSGSVSTNGLIGKAQGVTLRSYYDSTTSEQHGNSVGITALSDLLMKQASSFVGWNFDSTWDIMNGSTYPLLRAAGNANSSVSVVKQKPVSKNQSVSYSNGMLHISGTQTPLMLFDIRGHLVASISLDGKTLVPLRLTPGVYLFHGKGGAGQFVVEMP